ncbi:hypothetical protein MnTg02_02584 [bacterium MnTg02]|nr:hypothetical protein MnTg02_02584 [bacterium MnTg02]
MDFSIGPAAIATQRIHFWFAAKRNAKFFLDRLLEGRSVQFVYDALQRIGNGYAV